MAAGTRAPARWLFGPVPDLMFGCGLAYLLVFVVLVVAGAEVRSLVPVGALVLGGLITGTPHYGATLLRAYERREDRRGYALFTVWVTLVLAVAFVVGARDLRVASILFTIYVTWNAWHYTGQNYGIALMFLGRRGVEIDRRDKRLIYLTFVLSYALIVLSIHGADGRGALYAPQVDGAGTRVTFLPLSIPGAVQVPAMAAVAVAYLATIAGTGVLLARRAAWRDLGPTALLLLVQAVWFVLPTLARATGTFQTIEPLSQNYETYAFFWVAYAHAIQYLWITAYYAIARDKQVRRVGFFWKSVLAGSAIWGVPALVFAPQALGALPYSGGVFLLVASVVNIHHFILDGAIWKLRDGRIARILVRSERAHVGATEPRRGATWPLVWATGAVCAAIFVLDTWEKHFGYAAAYVRGDAERAETAVRRLAWIGRDGPEEHYRVAELLVKQRRLPEAMLHLHRSIELEPSARAWTALGQLNESRGEWREAATAYDRALSLAPESVPTLLQSGHILLRLGDKPSARARIERARLLDPSNPTAAALMRAAAG
jgi:tetratricopeptide (TPR) repeat protein